VKARILFLLLGLTIGAAAASWYFIHHELTLYESYRHRQEALKGTVSEPARLNIEDLYGLELTDPDGGPAPSIRESRDKVIFLGFWASWCMPCQAEFPDVEALKSKMGDRVVFYMLSDEAPDLIRATAKKYKLPFFSYGGEQRLPPYLRTYPVLPRTFILKGGRIQFERWGNAPWNGESAVNLLEQIAAE
jgi:thiol-disulfide isomerase/thioredoxin